MQQKGDRAVYSVVSYSAANLEELGRALRSRREALGMTREELSGKVDVTPAYIFLIESARPRSGGSPSRPRRITLKRWMEALALDEETANELLETVAYHPIDHALEEYIPGRGATSMAQRAEQDLRRAAVDIEAEAPYALFARAPRDFDQISNRGPAGREEFDLYHSRYLLQRRLDRLLDTSRHPEAVVERVTQLLDEIEGEG